MSRTNNNHEYVYMRVSKDKFRLPVAVADTIVELAKLCGTTQNCISSTISKGYGCYEKVFVGEDTEE